MPALKDLIPSGFHIVGQPTEEIQTVKNNAYDPITNKNVPPTINQGTGHYIVVIADNATPPHQRQFKIAINPDSPLLRGNGAAGNPQFVVRQTGVNDQPAPGEKVPPKIVYSGALDASGLDWTQSGAIEDVPQGRETPSAGSELERLDAAGKVIQPGDTTTVAVMVRDPKTGATNNIPKDASDAGVVTAVGNDLYIVKKDGTSVRARGPDGKPLTKPTEKTTTNISGIGLVEYDPDTSTAKVIMAAPADPTKEVFQLGGDGHTYRWDVASKTFVDSGLPPNKEAGSVYDPGEQSDSFMILGKDGSVLSTQKKPGWTRKPPFQPGQPTTSTTLPKIPSIDPQTGQIVYTDNPNRITASQATSDLAKSLGVKVAAGEMSEEDAQKLITNAVNGMNAQTSALSGMGTAAGNALQSITQGAQVGAGLLQNRVTAATGALQNIMGQATGSNMIAAPAAGTAGKLVSGLQGWVTELGGGQGAYDAAANLVQRADPTNQLGGDAAGAYAALGQAFQKYRDLTGTAHPLEQAAASATQANQPGGMPAPGAQPVAAASIPGPFTGPPPSLPAGPTGAPTNAVPGANYGTGYNTAQLAGPRWPNPQPLPPGTQVPYAFQSPAASTTTPTSSGGTININVH